MPPDLPWRGGAGCIEQDAAPAPSREPSAEELVALDDLSAPASPIRSVVHLLAQKKASGDLDRWKRVIAALPGLDSQTLILKVCAADDALTLWALHVHLDKRGVAPCLRWPGNTTTCQMRFITWAADLFWFARRNIGHNAKFQSWQRLLRDEPGSAQWLEKAYRMFAAMYGRQNVSSYTARGLALAHEQRQLLLTLPTSRMVAARTELQPTAFADITERLLSHATEFPDKSGAHSPQDIANRRAQLWRVHVLLGKRPTETARGWELLTGTPAKRQVISRQIEAIKAALSHEL